MRDLPQGGVISAILKDQRRDDQEREEGKRKVGRALDTLEPLSGVHSRAHGRKSRNVTNRSPANLFRGHLGPSLDLAMGEGAAFWADGREPIVDL